MIVTADGQQHTFSPSPASMTALLALTKTETILLWDPPARTLIAANVVGTWLAPTGLTRWPLPSPTSERYCQPEVVAEFRGTGGLCTACISSP